MQISTGLPAVLSVSVVLHNSPVGVLERTIISLERAALCAQASATLHSWRCVLVDNASSEAYRKTLIAMLEARRRAGAYTPELVELSDNRGFGVGHNHALHGMESDYHLILNPDVELEEEVLRAGLERLAEAPDIAALSPLACDGNQQREYLCKAYPSVMLLALRGFAPKRMQRHFDRQLAQYELREACAGSTEVEVPIVSGCFMLVRTSALRSIGGFNEAFFLYFEDFDLSLRLAEHGRLVFSPEMKIVHHGGYAASKGWRHIVWFVRSGVRFFALHGWRWW